MDKFNWKLWGKGLLAAVAGAVLSSLMTAATMYLSGTPVNLKAVGAASVTAALTTVVAYLKRSPLPITIDDASLRFDVSIPRNDAK